jgi:nitroreductase
MDGSVASAAVDAWNVESTAFPSDAPVGERLAFLVAYAVLAPSGHNTQPWRFRVVDDALELRADRDRRLPVVDPDDRALVISCGAALLHLRVAAQALERSASVELLPEGPHSDLLARLRMDGHGAEIPGAARLFTAIPRRRTNRSPFEDRLIPRRLLEQLVQDVEAEGARLRLVTDAETKQRLAALVAEGDRRQMSDRRFRRELASWVRSNNSRQPDGIRAHGFGIPDLVSHLGPLVMRTFDMGNRQAARDQQIAEGAPVLGVLGTDADDPPSWLLAGQALGRLLLRARSLELWASFLNQPIEVAALRPELAEVIGERGRPQLLLRLGYGPRPQPQPRRPAAHVLDTG